jgi:apolipoprotein N-acyltransferase
MLQISNVFAIAGLVFLTFAMASVVFLITNVLYGTAAALPVALVVLAVLGFSWFAVPLSRKVDDKR